MNRRELMRMAVLAPSMAALLVANPVEPVDWCYTRDGEVWWRTCDFCDECYMEDCWADRPIRQFYRFIDGGEIVCEHCLPAVLVENA